MHALAPVNYCAYYIVYMGSYVRSPGGFVLLSVHHQSCPPIVFVLFYFTRGQPRLLRIVAQLPR